jgi:hypothetical protein
MGEESTTSFTEEELKFIADAACFFEDPGVFIKALNVLGTGIEKAQKLLPVKAQKAVAQSVRFTIEKAVLVSAQTMPAKREAFSFGESGKRSERSGMFHNAGSALVGGVGGFFGFAALPVEIPVSTLIILRSIMDTAQHYGHDIASAEVRMECVYVFSFGSDSPKDDSTESSYYTSRIALSQVMKNAAAFVVGNSAKDILAAIENGTAPALLTFIAHVAEQFGVRVTKKLLAQTVPVIGAVGGAGINLAFSSFFKQAAAFHFGLRRLEIDRGYEETRAAFDVARKKSQSK